jgi:hypothetical protein
MVNDVQINMFYFVHDHINAKQIINVQDFLHLNVILKQQNKKRFGEKSFFFLPFPSTRSSNSELSKSARP